MSAPPSPLGPTFSSLHVDLSSLSPNSSHDQVSPSTSGGLSFSQVRLPSLRIPTSGPHRSPRLSLGFERPSVTQNPDPAQRYRDESRKLLAHILSQLRDREKPDSVFDAFRPDETDSAQSRDLRMTVRALQGVVKLKAGLSSKAYSEVSVQDDEDSNKEESSFSTDSTFILLSQFVSALAVAVKAGWQIFDDGYEVALCHNKCAQLQPPEIHLMDHR